MKCRGKIKYLDAGSARSIVNRMKRTSMRRRTRNQLLNPPKSAIGEHDTLDVYKCTVCTYYHVGHRPPWMTEAAQETEAPKPPYGSCYDLLVKQRLITVA